MAYNTRRKSVSLTQLGIRIPNSARSSSHRSPPATALGAPTVDNDHHREQQPPSKKIKRSHSNSSTGLLSPTSPSSPSRSPPPPEKNERSALLTEATPPPESGAFKVDTEGINDDIVVAVIEQLEKTGNRPHLLKELASILQHSVAIVSSSANQPAIISSRLATYMKRPWSALAPCPIGKELIGTHPKRIYFYLTTQPRQAFPDPPERADAVARIITPSLTSAENDEDKSSRSRSAMSPSPEVDLSTPELDHYESPMSTGEYFSHSRSLSQYSSHESSNTNLTSGRASPPLEGDEREFTQTATILQQRRNSEPLAPKAETTPSKIAEADETMADDSEESRAHHNRSDAAALFGQADTHLSVVKVSFMESSSPMLKPQSDTSNILHKPIHLQDQHFNEDFSNFVCESVEMDELDDLFAMY